MLPVLAVILVAWAPVAAPALYAGPPPGPAETRPSPAAPSPPGPGESTLEGLIAEALVRAPMLAARAAAVDSARARVRPAGALPDPMLEFRLQNVGFPSLTVGEEDMSMAGVEVRQGLPLPGKRRALRRAAAAAGGVRAAELERVRRELVLAVREGWAALYASDRERAQLQAATELLALVAGSATARYASGTGELEGMVKAGLARLRLAARADDLAAERAALAAGLGALLDRPGEDLPAEVAALPAVPSPPADAASLAEQRAADVAVAAARLEAAERELDVARRERQVGLAALGGFATRGALDPVVTLALGIELPVWRRDRQQPLVEAAAFERTAAEQELRAARAGARAAAERLLAGWRAADAQARRLVEAVLPQSELALEAARSAFETGRGDFSTVIEDFDLWLEAHAELARREAARFTAWAGLEALLGPSEKGGRP